MSKFYDFNHTHGNIEQEEIKNEVRLETKEAMYGILQMNATFQRPMKKEHACVVYYFISLPRKVAA